MFVLSLTTPWENQVNPHDISPGHFIDSVERLLRAAGGGCLLR